MAMTLRLNEDQDRALTLLARAQGSSKQEAALRAIITAASRVVADAEIADLARTYVPEYAGVEKRIRQSRS
ncbi:MAG: CopG family transcriptional regulator [Corynebacterium sp.]|uniref:CopG family transcriptional regulator n=1 Tax=uncultured Corynebacterium sp. TaxID=159447 RepID=UPI0017ADD77D|nr:CopG family transcriptional regulator [uncultured Corynebacterium sp.]NLZ58669.1 CopG family transcriptional regulator [Corynebacterium sp.]